MIDQYTVLPEFYDRLNGEADYDSYVDYLKKHIPKKASVIDLGCGTGEISIQLALDGYNVTGLDASDEMLSEAWRKSNLRSANVFYTCQDMTSFKVAHLYDAAVSCFDSFNYILTYDKLSCAFKCVFDSLASGGVFLFDMNAPAKFENLYADNTFVIEEEGIFCVWENEYNKRSKRCKFYINIFVDENETYKRYYEEQCEKSYKLQEITKALQDAGFTDISVSSDFSGGAVDEDTQRYYFIARKK